MLKILQITDLHIQATVADTLLGVNTAHYFEAVLAQALRDHDGIDCILLTGDLAQNPCDSSYGYIRDTLLPHKLPVICLPGNHDDWVLMQQHFNGEWLSTTKQWRWQHWQLLCVNSQIPGSAGGAVAADELAWLEQCLQQTPALPTMIAVHHNCFPTHSQWLDTMQISNSAAFLALIGRYQHVKIICCGHVHQAIAFEENGMAFYATPATCFQFTPLSASFAVEAQPAGYRILELYPDGQHHSRCYRIDQAPIGLDAGIDCY